MPSLSVCLDLPEVMEALKKAESFLEMTLTEKCNVSMLSLIFSGASKFLKLQKRGVCERLEEGALEKTPNFNMSFSF